VIVVEVLVATGPTVIETEMVEVTGAAEEDMVIAETGEEMMVAILALSKEEHEPPSSFCQKTLYYKFISSRVKPYERHNSMIYELKK